MRRLDLFASGQIGNGPSQAEDAGVGPGRQAEPVSDHLEQGLSFSVGLTEALQLARAHAGVAVNPEIFQAGLLDATGGFDAGTDVGAGFNGSVGCQFLVVDAGHLDMQVDAIQQRPGQAGAVALQQRRRAGAVVLGIAEESAGAGV